MNFQENTNIIKTNIIFFPRNNKNKKKPMETIKLNQLDFKYLNSNFIIKCHLNYLYIYI